MPRPKNTITRRQNLQKLGNQLANLLENPDLPHLVEEGILEYLCELGGVAPMSNPRILRAIYRLAVEEAEKRGVDVTEPGITSQAFNLDNATVN